MKFRLVSCLFHLAFFLALSQLFTACNKDNDPDKELYRLQSYTEQLLGQYTLDCSIVYDDERITQINYFYSDDDGEDSVKEEYAYPMDNVIVRTKYIQERGGWIPTWKEEMVFEGLQMTQSVSSSYDSQFQTWNESNKVIYLYSDGNIEEESSSHFLNGQWISDDRITYDYSGTNITMITSYRFDSDWEINSLENIFYDAGRISYSIGHLYSDGLLADSTRFEFQYENDLLISISFYNYGTHEQLVPYSFEYNEHQNLVAEHYTTGDDMYRKDYTYENGKGNFEQMKDPGGQYVLFSVFPYPTK